MRHDHASHRFNCWDVGAGGLFKSRRVSWITGRKSQVLKDGRSHGAGGGELEEISAFLFCHWKTISILTVAVSNGFKVTVSADGERSCIVRSSVKLSNCAFAAATGNLS